MDGGIQFSKMINIKHQPPCNNHNHRHHKRQSTNKLAQDAQNFPREMESKFSVNLPESESDLRCIVVVNLKACHVTARVSVHNPK